MPIPAIIGAGATIGSSLLSRQGQTSDQKAASVAQTGAMNSQSALARQTTDFARRQYSLAEPAYSKALQYYTGASGAGGNAALQQSLVPQYRQIGDIYSGAQKGLAAGTARGATRDVQSAELNRQRVGQTADITAAARTNAVGKLADMGSSGVAGSAGMNASASGMFGESAGTGSNLYGQALERQRVSQERGSQMGASMFKLFMPWLQARYGGGSGGKGGGAYGGINSEGADYAS
jgi:hypothetical protein